LVGEHLQEMLGVQVDYSFVQPLEDEDKDFVFFDSAGNVVSELERLPDDVSPIDLLSKSQLETLSESGEGIYLLDMSFVPGNYPLSRSLRKYGLRLAQYLQAENTDKYVFMFTNYSDEVLGEWNKDGRKYWVDTHAKEILSGPDESQDEAAQILAARLFGCVTQAQPRLVEPTPDIGSFPDIIGRSERMQAVYRLIKSVAATNSTVLLSGESGTGKDLVAKAIHHTSERADKPLVTINCAAIPSALIESELFGYEKGAFTDAKARKEGLIEKAEGGTLFLDEIGELELSLQAKLLRVLEEKKFRRVGGVEDIPLNVRFLAASNRDLKIASESGTFRADLYYRLSVIPIEIPPLRDRGDDVLLLADHYIRQSNEKYKRNIKGLSPQVAKAFRAFSWPGNVRELGNVIERAVILQDTPLIRPNGIDDDIIKAAPHHSQRLPAEPSADHDAWTRWRGIKNSAKGGHLLAKMRDRIEEGESESRSFVWDVVRAAVNLACNNPDTVRSDQTYCQPIRKLMMLLEEMHTEGLLDTETLHALANKAGARGSLDFMKLKKADGTYANIGGGGLKSWKTLHREALASLIKSKVSAAVAG
jgi:DNA-binding NtrC family response regulator